MNWKGNFWRVVIILFPYFCFAQQSNEPYCGFHEHISFKHYYWNVKDPSEILKDSLNHNLLNNRYGKLNWQEYIGKSRALRLGKESHFRNYYQADYSQQAPMPGSIICNAFYPYEKIMEMTCFNRLLDRLAVSKLRLKRLKTIAADSNYPFREFMAEYLFLDAQDSLYAGKKIKFVRNNDELRKNRAQNVTSVLMTIEGGQVLTGRHTAQRGIIKDEHTDLASRKEILDNTRKLKNLPHRLFFITMGHFSWNRVTGYAKTLDKFGLRRLVLNLLSKSENIRASLFYKPSQGLQDSIDCVDSKVMPHCCKNYSNDSLVLYLRKCNTALGLGREVIKEFLNPDSNLTVHKKPVYIDVKHMDIMARMQYYKLRDTLTEKYKIPIPIIVSHTAVSGENCAIAQATGLFPNFDIYSEVYNPGKYYKKQKKKDCLWKHMYGHNPFNTINEEAVNWFYPWSINLYDEEIGIVHESDGIMGLMLDGRLLGECMPNYTRAYRKYCQREFKKIIAKGKYNFSDFSEYYETIPFMRNMVYIATHCVKKGEEKPNACWEHLALGTDFDGLIHPLKVCRRASEIPVFKAKLKDYFKIYLIMTECENHLYPVTNTDLVINKLFFKNGEKFTLKYF